jgi:nucleotidyltransferase substrate binding protein (TIGR01987 family)
MEDIRWKQRFMNFENALKQLVEGVDKFANTEENIIKEGIIQRFEFTHELAWKVLKDYLEYEGLNQITGSRTATREAFNKNILENGEVWMEMIESRNNTVHTYQASILEEEYEKIIKHYLPALISFEAKMKQLI